MECLHVCTWINVESKKQWDYQTNIQKLNVANAIYATVQLANYRHKTCDPHPLPSVSWHRQNSEDLDMPQKLLYHLEATEIIQGI